MLVQAPIGMNKTETKAYAWLLKKGYHDIVFQRRTTPDFLTREGGFEVKRLAGRAISFSYGQKQRVIEQNATVLVFDDAHNEPVLSLKPEDLNKRTIAGYMINIWEQKRHINVVGVYLDDDTRMRILNIRSASIIAGCELGMSNTVAVLANIGNYFVKKRDNNALRLFSKYAGVSEKHTRQITRILDHYSRSDRAKREEAKQKEPSIKK